MGNAPLQTSPTRAAAFAPHSPQGMPRIRWGMRHSPLIQEPTNGNGIEKALRMTLIRPWKAFPAIASRGGDLSSPIWRGTKQSLPLEGLPPFLSSAESPRTPWEPCTLSDRALVGSASGRGGP